MVSTYFPHVRREVMLLDMLARACLAKGEILYKNRNATEYICLLREKKFHETMLYKFGEV